MDNIFIIANWKSNKTKSEAKAWLNEFAQKFRYDSNKVVVVCPPFTLLPLVSSFVKKNALNVKVGSQDISPRSPGSFTGEVNAVQIKEYADYVIVGHSERRVNFGEDISMVNEKVEQVLKNNLVPILCVSDLSQLPEDLEKKVIVAYEPIAAIGTGNPESKDIVGSVASKIKEKFGSTVVYGGSVNSQNVSDFTKVANVSGVLVGSASLSPETFLQIIENA